MSAVLCGSPARFETVQSFGLHARTRSWTLGDGQTTSIYTYNQPKFTGTATISRTTRLRSLRHKTARSGTPWKAPRPTTPIVTTTTTKATAVGQATHTTEAHDNDQGGADDDGDDDEDDTNTHNTHPLPTDRKSTQENQKQQQAVNQQKQPGGLGDTL